MAHHLLEATPESVGWGYWDATRPPALEIDSGDTVTIETLSGEHEDLPQAGSGYTVLPDHRAVVEGKSGGPGPHLLTGPIYVRDATPGDVLQVQVNKIALRQDWGWNVQIPLLGTLPDEYPDFRRIYTPIDPDSGKVSLPWGQQFQCRPFFGCMGVAPPLHHGRLSSIEPRAFGGNMDNKELGAGATIQFPVFTPGALFSAGDGHALQGDGEVCLTAVETALTGTFTFRLIKAGQLTRPRAVTQTDLITMAFDEDLDDAARSALREMIDLIVQTTGLSREDAYTFCSIAADLRITQTVNRHKGVHCIVAKNNLPDAGQGLNRLFLFD
ncbi:acetamidase/formamidase family protein [Pusillimonas sp.]|uniref:acetamidase/formamidase family protein n=1 Tax=Pusillimonas sp. TaxID=3040095 RepID=UPI0037C4F864